MNRYVTPMHIFRPFFSSVESKIAVPMFLGALTVLIVMVFSADWNSLKFSGDADIRTVEGDLFDITSTSTSVNEQPVLAYHFRFSLPDDGKLYEAVCYETGNVSFESNIVVVEYIADNPELARIQGMRTGILPPLFSLFALPFFGAAVWLGRTAWKRGRLITRLLPNGEIASGRLVMQNTTNTRINNRSVMACTFEFEVDGEKYRVVGKTHRPEFITDELEERILYDPADPSRAFLFDLLPKKIQAFIEGS